MPVSRRDIRFVPGLRRVLSALLLAGLASPAGVGAQSAQDLASLNPGRAVHSFQRETIATDARRVSAVNSRAEALVLLQKLEAQLRAAPRRPMDAGYMSRQAREARDFLQKVRARRIQSAPYQWHQVSRVHPESGTRRVVLRPIQAVPYVSAIDISIDGGPVSIEAIRAHGASGVVFDFRPRGESDSGGTGERLRFCFDREINLTGVEVFCKPIRAEGVEIGVQGGIAVEPAPVAETYCLRALELAGLEIRRQRFDVAARHVHNSIDLLQQVP